MKNKKRILYGVLDWGLGHATRSIPLIEELLKAGYSVDILSNGRALMVLKKEFKSRCNYIDSISPYVPQIQSKFWMGGFIVSLPKQAQAFIAARIASKKIIQKGNYDLVIADNRLDVYDRKDNSYIMTHNIRFETYFFLRPFFNFFTYLYCSRFGHVLIPDYEGENALAGRLSNNITFIPKKMLIYLGIISRVKKKNVKKDIDYFITLSGPEPQRTTLENLFLSQIKSLKGKIVFSGASPEGSKVHINDKNIKFYPYLNKDQQEDFLNRSKVIITRSGYTTLMELAEIGISKAVIIPTPGQTEQEYLGKLSEKNRWWHSADQSDINLSEIISNLKEFKGYSPSWKTEKSVKKFINIIKKHI